MAAVRRWSNAYTAMGARECVPIYNALDLTTHFPVDPDPRFASDFAFLANRLPDREERVEEFFLKPAAMLPGARFLIGGNGWADKDMPPNVRAIGHVGTGSHNAFNCTPRAVLNVARNSMAEIGFSPATRVFEAAGAGACLITDAWEGIEMFLQPGYRSAGRARRRRCRRASGRSDAGARRGHRPRRDGAGAARTHL